MDSDDLSLALHAIRGDITKVTLNDGILVWLPTSSSSSSSTSSSSVSDTTTPSSSSTEAKEGIPVTGTHTDTPVTIDPAISALVLAGCRRVQELTHNHPSNKTEALHRGIFPTLCAAIKVLPTSTSTGNIPSTTIIATGATEVPTILPSHTTHHHYKHHMGVHTVAIRVIKSIVFKHEAGKRAAGPTGIVLQTLELLRYALALLPSNEPNSLSTVSIDEFTLGLGLIEETLTTLVALCTGAGGEDNLVLIKEGGKFTIDELSKATDVLTKLQKNWTDTPLGKYQKMNPVPNTKTLKTIFPFASSSGISVATINPSESLKRIVFLQALL